MEEKTETSSTNLHVLIHPLVVMSIADHQTREKVQNGGDRVIGVVFGEQEGREVTIFESFEIAFTVDEASGKIKPEIEALETDMKLFTEVYPNYECLGWYTTGKDIREGDMELHKKIAKYNERPLFLMVDPSPDSASRDLPLVVYEETVSVANDRMSSAFVRSNFELKTDEAERITAVHCAKVVTGPTAGGTSELTPHFAGLRKAITMLNSRIQLLAQYLKDTQSGAIPKDHATLREIKGLCQRLPVMDLDSFSGDLNKEFDDTMLVSYLATMTKGAALANEVVAKFNTAHNSGGGLAGKRGRSNRHSGYDDARGGGLMDKIRFGLS